jgi:trk system potassium uptake protein TrkA
VAGKQRSVVIIGLGTFGRTIALELARVGDYVLGVDIDEGAVASVADAISEAVIADGRDEQALREAGVGRYDVAVVAIGEELEANILCTMNTKRLGVGTVWAKAISRTHQRILTKIGADRVIQPEHEIGQHVAQMLHNPLLRDYLQLEGDLFVVQIKAHKGFHGTKLPELRLHEEYGLRCLGLLRDATYVSCDRDDVTVQSGDGLLILGKAHDLRAFGENQ